jgi:hypothetical protein
LLSLLTDLNTLSILVFVLILKDLELVVQAGNDVLLTLNLSFVVTLQGCNAYVELLLAALQVLDMGLKVAEVTLKELVGLDLCPVGGDDSVSDTIGHGYKLILLSVLVLNLLELKLLSLFSLLAMLLIEPIALSLLHDGHILLGASSRGRLRASKRSASRALIVRLAWVEIFLLASVSWLTVERIISYISGELLAILTVVSRNVSFSIPSLLLSMLGSPLARRGSKSGLA